MTAAVSPRRQADDDDPFFDGLRASYENAGFAFIAHPTRAQLPDFLASYVPVALAAKPGLNVAIEVRRRPDLAEPSLTEIRRLFDGRPEWQLRVVFRGTDLLRSISIAPASRATLRDRFDEVRGLVAQGHHRSAFVLAWSLLEAALRLLDDIDHALSPETVVQTLAMNGHIEPETERDLRSLTNLRNRIVHGDLIAEPAREDVELLLNAVEESLFVESS